MAIIVYDGTNLEDANSFIEISEATTYHSNRGNTIWTDVEKTDDDREKALIRTFDYLCTLKYKTGVFYEGTPVAIKKAQAEGALRELETPGCLQPDLSKDDFITKKVYTGAIETTYASNARTVYQKLMVILKPYLVASNVRQLVRG